jgi:type I restriction enzyme S subunit
MSEVRTKLPEGWAVAEGKDLFSFIRGVTYTRNEATKEPDVGRFGVLRAGNLQKGMIIVDDLVYVPEKRVDADQLIRRHDIVVAMSSGSRSIVGKAAVSETDIRDISFGAFCGLIRPLMETTAPWLNLYFQSEGYRQIMSDLSSGININNLRPDHFLSLRILLPPGREIQRIVNRAKELQLRSRRARETLETVPDLLEQLRQSLLAAAFRGDLTKEWRKKNPDVEPASELLKRIRAERRKRWEEDELEKLKARGLTDERLEEEFAKRHKEYKEPSPVDTSNLPELPKGWIWESMERVCKKIMDGAHHSPPNSPIGDRIYLTAKNVRPWHIDMSNLTYVSEKDHRDIYMRCDVKYRDVLYVKDGVNAGMTALNTLKEPFSLLSSVGVFRPEDGLLPEYVVSYLNSPIGHRLILSMVSGNAITRLTLVKLKSAVIPVAPLMEQQEICSLIDEQLPKAKSLDIKIGKMISDLQIQDQAILAKAFRGELVPQDPNDEPASVLLERIREEKTRMAAKQQINLKQRGMKKMGRKRRLGGSPGAVHADRRRPGEEKETSHVKQEVD